MGGNVEGQDILSGLIGKIHIHEEPQKHEPWLKAIEFRLPVIDEDVFNCLDIQHGIECVAQFSRLDPL